MSMVESNFRNDWCGRQHTFLFQVVLFINALKGSVCFPLFELDPSCSKSTQCVAQMTPYSLSSALLLTRAVCNSLWALVKSSALNSEYGSIWDSTTETHWMRWISVLADEYDTGWCYSINQAPSSPVTVLSASFWSRQALHSNWLVYNYHKTSISQASAHISANKRLFQINDWSKCVTYTLGVRKQMQKGSLMNKKRQINKTGEAYWTWPKPILSDEGTEG